MSDASLIYLQAGNQVQPIQSDQVNQVVGGQTTPSLSPTPSPAGSVGSVGSQSSGYSSGELASRGTNLSQVQASTAAGPASPCILLPLPVFNALTKQSQSLPYLLSYQDLWDQADGMIINGNSKGIY